MQSIVNLTTENEARLKSFKTLLAINKVNISNKDALINKSIEVLDTLVNSLDEDSLIELTNLKKTF